MLINSCQSVEMNKWISDNLQELSNMTTTEEFNIAVRNAHNEMLLNKGLPSYDGKGVGQSKTNINSVSGDRKKTDGQEEWLKKQPCFQCTEHGHTHRECTKTNITTCKMENCTKKHNMKAHQNLMEYLEKKEG